jgi:hypothetical protein
VKAIDNTLVHKLLTQAGRGERRPWLVEDDLKAVRKAVSEFITSLGARKSGSALSLLVVSCL